MTIVNSGAMNAILIYCRPSGDGHTSALRAWLEQRAAALSTHPLVRSTTAADLSGAGTDGGDRGWLLECELDDAAAPPGDLLGELLTDMRLVGLRPVVFTAQPTTGMAREASAETVSMLH